MAESLGAHRPVAPNREIGSSYLAKLAEEKHLMDQEEIILSPSDVDLYDKNPRSHQNEIADEELKEAMRKQGFKGTLEITRRNERSRWMVSAGGNRRLKALQSLEAEGIHEFRKIKFKAVPFSNEPEIFVAHLVENEVREDMTFWDKAQSVITFRKILEAEAGAGISISNRELERRLKSYGLTTVSKTEIGYRVFAVEHLSSLNDLTDHLTGLAVQQIQRKYNALLGVAEIFDIKESFFKSEYVEAASREFIAVTDVKNKINWDEWIKLIEKKLEYKLKLEEDIFQFVLEIYRKNNNIKDKHELLRQAELLAKQKIRPAKEETRVHFKRVLKDDSEIISLLQNEDADTEGVYVPFSVLKQFLSR